MSQAPLPSPNHRRGKSQAYYYNEVGPANDSIHDIKTVEVKLKL
ncbi:MAG: hypothetical protein ACE365_01820 [Gammaproteobacteria bacterium]